MRSTAMLPTSREAPRPRGSISVRWRAPLILCSGVSPVCETRNGVLRFDPAVPKELGRLVFDVQYRGLWIGCEVTEDHVVLDVSSGPGSPITVAVRDTEFVMEPGSLPRGGLG